MCLPILFLISPAFGMPSDPLFQALPTIINQIDSLPGATEEIKAIFQNSNLTELIAARLEEAEKNIAEMDAALESQKNVKLQFEKKYFEEYNEAKRYLRETRQGLRKLADKTVLEVENLKFLLGELDNSVETTESTFLLKESLGKMKDLMIETLKTLREANQKYNSALETFENLNISIEKQNLQLGNMLDEDSAEYEEWKTKMRGGVYGTIGTTTTACIIADLSGALGICSGVNLLISSVAGVVAESKIDDYEATLEKLKTITQKMLENGNMFDQTINEAIDIFNKEIELINKWTNSAEVVNKNIDKYPLPILKKYRSIRPLFVKGLDDLENAAKDFLAQPVDILG